MTLIQSKDQEKIKQMQERERIRHEVHAELQQQANAFVQEQIKLAHTQMYAEIERRVAEHTGQTQLHMQQTNTNQDPPLSQNRSQMQAQERSEISYELQSDKFSALKELNNRIRNSKIAGPALDPTMPQVLSNGEILAGLIGNASEGEMEF